MHRGGDIAVALDYMRSKLRVERIVCGGLCSGAESAVRAALDPSLGVSGLLLVNGGLDYTEQQLVNARERQDVAFYRARMRHSGSWRRALQGKSNYRAVFTKLFHALRSAAAPRSPTAAGSPWASLDRLGTRSIPCLLVLSTGCVSWYLLPGTRKQIMRRAAQSSALTLRVLDPCDHDLTPLWAQRELITQATEWLRSLT
jgi:pimeloyl-ACP methyl ester carboxylesterase